MEKAAATGQCTELARLAPNRVSAELATRISEWAPRTGVVLLRRHRVIHGVVVEHHGARGEDPVERLWYFRADRANGKAQLAGDPPTASAAVPSSPEDLRQVVDELTAQIVATVELCRAAAVEAKLFVSE